HVVAGLHVSRRRRPTIRLRNAAEVIVRHQRAPESDIPRGHFHHLRGLDRHVRRYHGRFHTQEACSDRHQKLIHRPPLRKNRPPGGRRLTPGDRRIATVTELVGHKLTLGSETLARRNSRQVRDFWAFPPFW